MLASGVMCTTVAVRPAASRLASARDTAMPTVHVVGHRLTSEERRATQDAAE
jgi:hypothetical protein